MSSKLEQLPWLVLSRICEYLDADDDDVDTHQIRTALWSFSLASRHCCAIAASQRFCQVRVVAVNASALVRELERCVEMLDGGGDGGRYRHVRRLKLRPPKQLHVREDGDWTWAGNIYAPAPGDMHPFCRPAMSLLDPRPLGSAATHQTWVVVLTDFISRLPALRDFVWGFSGIVPPPVLAAVHAAAGCRLHVHGLWLRNVKAGRGGVVDVDPDEYALVTSPALCSVVATVLDDIESDGEITFCEEAVLGMVAGAAPNLQHVWLVGSSAGGTHPLRQAYPMGKPPVPSGHPLFFPEAGRRGSLRSLFFISSVPRTIDTWAARTDISKLRRLASTWDPACVDVLTAMAARGELASLKGLCLKEVPMDGAPAGRRLLAALGPNSLRYLDLDGHVNEDLFDAALSLHGTSLRHLSVNPYPDYRRYDPVKPDAPPPPYVATPGLSARLAETCVNLEYLLLDMRRTNGDARECAVYRGLGRLPRLRRLALRLHYAVHPADTIVPDEHDDFSDSPKEMPRPMLAQAFANAAVDARLARAVFDLVSGPNGGLQQLQLLPYRITTRSSPAAFDWRFYNLLRWFAREWVCERRSRGGGHVETRELRPRDTAAAGDEWRDLDKALSPYEDEDQGGEVYVEAFGDAWPEAMGQPRWWKGWASMPLCPDGSD